MSKLTQFLQKAGLVESEDSPLDLPSSAPSATDPPLPAPDVTSRTRAAPAVSGRAKFAIDSGDENNPGGDGAMAGDASSEAADYVLPEGVAFEQLFQEAGVPDAAFPIERLQKLIEGLRQLDPTTQKAAVLAMDAADETWTIEGVLKDAQLKTDALHAYLDRVTAKTAQIQGNIERDIAGMTSAKDSAITDIQAQIAELQKKLEATASQHASGISTLAGKKTTAQQAADRERQRVNECINRINNLIHPFLSPVSNR
jgi:hypothetical protein